MISALLWLGGRALKVLGSIPVWAYAAAALFAWGAYGHHKATNAKLEAVQQEARAEAKLRQEEQTARETERLRARNAARVSDALIQERLQAVRDANALRERLRQQSNEAIAASAAASDAIYACRGAQGATAARVLPSDVGQDLVTLMEEAERVSASLRLMQSVCTHAP